MKPYLIRYTHRDQGHTARVVADSEREAEARFRNSHPAAGDIQISATPARPPLTPQGSGPLPATVRFTRPVNETERERIVSHARRLTADLRRQLSTRPNGSSSGTTHGA